MDCIHYVPFEELIALEKAREGQIINFKARLVGNDGLLSSNGANIQKGKDTTPRISSDGKIRCNNCPTRGCHGCPMFGVGRDPEFRKLQRKGASSKTERNSSESTPPKKTTSARLTCRYARQYGGPSGRPRSTVRP